MRIVAYILILVGLMCLVDAARDEHRGIASARSPSRSARLHIVSRAEDPEQFRGLMAYQWVRGPLALLGGLIILGICRRADRLDPFSPDFAGSDALDELNRALTEEEQKRHRPIK